MRRKFLTVIICLVLCACSSSDDTGQNGSSTNGKLPDLTIIGFEEDLTTRTIEYLQFDYDSDSRTGSVTNLTEEMGLRDVFKTEVDGKRITFYNPGRVQRGLSDRFILWQKNLDDNSISQREGFFDLNKPEEPISYTTRGEVGLIIWRDTNPENIDGDGTFNLMLRVLDEVGNTEDFLINRLRFGNLFEPLVIRNFLLIPYNDLESRIMVVDLDKKEMVDEISNISGFYMVENGSGDVLIFGSKEIFTYDLDTRNISSPNPVNFDYPRPVPLEQDYFSEGKLFLGLEMAQPAPFLHLPAVYCLDTDELRSFSPSNEILAFEGVEFNERPFPRAFVFDTRTNHYLIGVANVPDLNAIIMLNLDGEIVDAIDIPFTPQIIVPN